VGLGTGYENSRMNSRRQQHRCGDRRREIINQAALLLADEPTGPLIPTTTQESVANLR